MLGRIAGFAAAFLVMTSAALNAAQAQGICLTQQCSCQKGKTTDQKGCVVKDHFPKQQFYRDVYEFDGLRWIQKVDRHGQTRWGIARASNNKTVIEPECVGGLPMVDGWLFACLKDDGALTFFKDDGSVYKRVTDTVPFEADVFAAEPRHVTHHDESMVFRQQTADGEKTFMHLSNLGRDVELPQGIVPFLYRTYEFETAVNSINDGTRRSARTLNEAQLFAEPTEFTARLSDELGDFPVYRLLGPLGTVYKTPDETIGFIRVDPRPVPQAYVTVFDTDSGMRFELVGSRFGAHPRYAQQNGMSKGNDIYVQISTFTTPAGVLRYDERGQSFLTPAGTSLYAGQREDGMWVLHRKNDPSDAWSPPGLTPLDAFENEVQRRLQEKADFELAAQREAEEEKRLAALRAVERQKQKAQQQVTAVRCQAGIAATLSDGRWAGVPDNLKHTVVVNTYYGHIGAAALSPVYNWCDGFLAPEGTPLPDQSAMLDKIPTSDLYAVARTTSAYSTAVTLISIARARGDNRADFEQAALCGRTGACSQWVAYANLAAAGSGEATFLMGAMEYAQKPEFPHTMEGWKEEMEFLNYVYSYVWEASNQGYNPPPGQTFLTSYYARREELESRIEYQESKEYWQRRMNLWTSCRRGADPGYEFTCYTNSRGDRVSPWTGRKY